MYGFGLNNKFVFGTAIAFISTQRESSCIRQLSGIRIKKARSNDLANLLTLGVRANTVSVRLAGLENEYWPLNQTSTLSVLLVGFFFWRFRHKSFLGKPSAKPFAALGLASQFLPSIEWVSLLPKQLQRRLWPLICLT